MQPINQSCRNMEHVKGNGSWQRTTTEQRTAHACIGKATLSLGVARKLETSTPNSGALVSNRAQCTESIRFSSDTAFRLGPRIGIRALVKSNGPTIKSSAKDTSPLRQTSDGSCATVCFARSGRAACWRPREPSTLRVQISGQNWLVISGRI